MPFFKPKEKRITFNLMELFQVSEELAKECGIEIKNEYSNIDFDKHPSKTPLAVINVYQLIRALEAYEKPESLPEKVDIARVCIMKELTANLNTYMNERTKGRLQDRHDEDIPAFKNFTDNCNRTMTTHSKSLASQPTLWNEIQDKLGKNDEDKIAPPKL